MIKFKKVPLEEAWALKMKMLRLASEIHEAVPDMRVFSLEDISNTLGMEILCRTTNLSFDELQERLSENNEEWAKKYLLFDVIKEKTEELIAEITKELKKQVTIH